MKKRILSLLLLAAVMASLLVPAVQAAAPANRFYDLNGDGTYDVCVYDGAKPSNDKNATYLKVGNGVKLSDGDSGYLMYGTDYNLKWHDFMYVRPVPNSAIQIT